MKATIMKTARKTKTPSVEYMPTGNQKKVTELVRGDIVADLKMFGSDVVVTVEGTRFINDERRPYTVVYFYGIPESCACSHAAYANYYDDDDMVSTYQVKP